MMRFGQFIRLAHINLVLLRHGLDELVLDTPLFRPVRFVKVFMFWRWFKKPAGTRGERIRQALEDLGPIWIKLGQILSTRRDILPIDIAVELAKLQDRVPPFPGKQARLIVEASLGMPLAEAFAYFDEKPLASASIAQVHVARLLDGREVVVKVTRPGIEKVIRGDIDIMYTVAEVAERYSADARRLRPLEVVAEFEKNIFDELDLQREAANASQLRRNFANSELLYIPEVHWPLVRRDVMVMERIYGLPISSTEELRARGTDMQKLAERGVEIFFTQVFRDSFFHADMHPGNIFADISDPADPRYVAVDFGIVGTLAPKDHRYLAENFLAFFRRDYRRVAELHVESGWVPSSTRIDEFEAAIRAVSEPIFERPLKEISFGALLLRLFQTGRRFDMVIQPQLVLLQKTLLNIEGLGRELYPDLDLWKTAKPYMERWMRQELGTQSVVRRLRRELPAWGEYLPELPARVHRALGEVQQIREELARQSDELRQLREQSRRASRRSFSATFGAALLLGALLLLGLESQSAYEPSAAPLLSWILGGLGALMLFVGWLRD